MFQSDDINSIGKNIRILRKEKMYTMKQLADSINSSQGYISDIEHGKTIPSISKLMEICTALDISLKEFFDETIEEDYSNEKLKEIMKSMKSLSPNQINLINELLKTIV